MMLYRAIHLACSELFEFEIDAEWWLVEYPPECSRFVIDIGFSRSTARKTHYKQRGTLMFKVIVAVGIMQKMINERVVFGSSIPGQRPATM